MWGKVRLGALTLFIPLLVGACYQVNMELDFETDGSGTMSVALVIDASLMRFAALEGGSAADACRNFADEAIGSTEFPGTDVQVDHVLQVDGSCSVTVVGSFTADEFNSDDEVHISVSDDGWSLIMGGVASSVDEALTELGTDDLGLLGDVTLRMSVRLPGTPSDDHNAHRIEDGRFIWEFSGAGFEDAPVALRASSKVDTPNEAWMTIVIAGAGTVLAGGLVVLVALSVARRRRRAVSQPIVSSDLTTPWEAPTAPAPSFEDDGANLPPSRYRPPTEGA